MVLFPLLKGQCCKDSGVAPNLNPGLAFLNVNTQPSFIPCTKYFHTKTNENALFSTQLQATCQLNVQNVHTLKSKCADTHECKTGLTQ